MAAASPPRRPGVCMVGTGEYTTGYVGGGASKSDKGAGVVALTMFDLRKKGKVGRLAMCGTNGAKFTGIRAHIAKVISATYPGSAYDTSFESYPAPTVKSYTAYIEALDSMSPGDAVIIFTPDDTHFDIALAAVQRDLHVLVTKPIVKTLAHHVELVAAAREHNVLVQVEVHKRWDPIYQDAHDRIITNLGAFSHLDAYMSQPKHQLETFKAWAGRSSDISYYLNSHHIDFHEWCAHGNSRPIRVTACEARGVATELGIETEDTITLLVQWENRPWGSGSLGSAVYTSSWVAPRADVHSQQRFFYMGQKGEVKVDQAHRGYTMAEDGTGFSSQNPLFMKYTPDAQGCFAGQRGYGYLSFEAFIDAVNAIRAGDATPESFDTTHPTGAATMLTTAILEAGRVSLDSVGRPVKICYEGDESETVPTSIELIA